MFYLHYLILPQQHPQSLTQNQKRKGIKPFIEDLEQKYVT